MLTKIISIGNSRGIRIPKAMLEHVGLEDDVHLEAKNGRLILTPARKAREGWAKAFAAAEGKEDPAADAAAEFPSTVFEEEEWEW